MLESREMCKEYMNPPAKEKEGQIKYPEGMHKDLKIISKYGFHWK